MTDQAKPMTPCTHDLAEMETAAACDGLCPICEHARANALQAERDEARRLLAIRERIMASSKDAWIKSAKRALAGDLIGLYVRVQLSETKDFDIVQSEAAAKAKENG